MMNCNHFQVAMLAYNLKSQGGNSEAHHAGDGPPRFLFLAAKIWRHTGRVGVSYSDHYAEQGVFCRLMVPLRAIARDGQRFGPVLATALTG